MFSINSHEVAAAADFGAQGGDPSRGVDVDLSTCVNPGAIGGGSA